LVTFFNVKKEQLVSFLSEAASVLDALETHTNLVIKRDLLVGVPVGVECLASCADDLVRVQHGLRVARAALSCTVVEPLIRTRTVACEPIRVDRAIIAAQAISAGESIYYVHAQPIKKKFLNCRSVRSFFVFLSAFVLLFFCSFVLSFFCSFVLLFFCSFVFGSPSLFSFFLFWSFFWTSRRHEKKEFIPKK
jgi:hypothetical protein